ncbi:esterase-like activity of phytase family protein [Nonomuraea phyllanthi]|uniref:Esterase-like activity of phytase family protein n=1 Tax=Nonomuraea phyllanthi TaxID=2219224 RepID=A0A5C4WQL4_9ACTN|nr:esterase-like activity of phytase family protein [Nonomuraea phyllanthi]KAB8195388.1 esterase-like activity of phytase family protein [Nonomuraea phyllanthi]
MEIAVAFAVVVGAATPASAAPAEPVRITRFLGEQRLPHMMRFEGTTVGGLSGIDRDPATDTWYFVSDDRWRYNPARFYTGRLDFDRETGEFGGVRLTGVTTLTRADGTPYPAYGSPGSADPESMRYDPWAGRLLWGDEGDRPDTRNPAIPVSPSGVRLADIQGHSVGEMGLPSNLRLTDTESGPRRNFGFEGLAVSARAITAVTEGPRFEDGPVPTTERGAPARITVWSRQGSVRGQYVYPIDPLPAAPVPSGGDADSGVSEILPIDGHRYLALERSWIQGVGYRVKLYEFDLRGATNVLARDDLSEGVAYQPVRKRLVYDLGTFRPPVQNLESLAWGPRLASGECTLVMGSDDNFDQSEVTQFLAFGATGCP